jgi:small subunit ribosomal protein S16
LAVRLRLRRMGRKKRPFYRIVAADQRSPRDGRFIEVLGIYDPLQNPHKVEVNEERITYWLDQGAQPSDTVRSLLSQRGIMYRRELTQKGVEPEKISEEMKKWEVLQIEKNKRRAAVKLQARIAKKEKADSEKEQTAVEPEKSVEPAKSEEEGKA